MWLFGVPVLVAIRQAAQGFGSARPLLQLPFSSSRVTALAVYAVAHYAFPVTPAFVLFVAAGVFVDAQCA